MTSARADDADLHLTGLPGEWDEIPPRLRELALELHAALARTDEVQPAPARRRHRRGSAEGSG